MANRIFPDQPDPGDQDEQGPWSEARTPGNPLGMYILDEQHNIIPARNTMEWAMFLENIHLRQVAEDHIGVNWVSTVFLGLDHSFGRPGPPILFETARFYLGTSDIVRRYRTWDEAAAGHQEVLEELRNWIKNQ